MNRIQSAAQKIKQAIDLLKEAKKDLRYARNDQHIPVAVQIAALEEIYDILNDPTCTPEFWEEDEYV